MRTTKLGGVTSVAAMLFTVMAAQATPVQWQVEEGGNGHWYELVTSETILTWHEAQAAAEASGGYLVTVTSQAETDFLLSALGASEIQHAWTGAYQDRNAPEYSEPGGGWKWITGELWDYTNWEPASGEPNNVGGIEDYVDFHGASPSVPGSWADVRSDPPGNHYKYVIEAVPEPSSIFILALSGCALMRRRR